MIVRSPKSAYDPPVAMSKIQALCQKAFQHLKETQISDAQNLYNEALTLSAQNAEDHNHLGLAAYHLHRLSEALKHYQKALHLNEQEPAYYNNISLALSKLGEFSKAEQALEKCRVMFPNHIPTFYNLGVLYQNQNDLTAAQKWFQTSVEKDEKMVPAWVGLASVADKLGDLEASQKYAETALKYQPDHPDATATLSSVFRQNKKYQQASEVLLSSLKKHPRSVPMHYEMGHTLHALKNYPQALKHFDFANKLQDSKRVQRSEVQTETKELISFYQSLHAKPQQTSLDSPIFVVGSPRSGTTLLAQMLGMHQNIFNAGELETSKQLLQVINQDMGSPNNSKLIWQNLWKTPEPEKLDQWRQWYTQQLQSLPSQENQQILDKLPSNARRLGLIAKIFPQSPIIHIIRDGREVAFSAYTQNFRNYMWHAHDLENAIFEWTSTIELARAGAKATGIPYLEIRYEDLITSTEEVLKTVFTFLKRPFQQECLLFHQSKNTAHTASYQQVRQKIYKTSLSKAKNYPEIYKKLTTWGEPTLQQLGYLT